MNHILKFAQLYLRLALGIGFIVPVLDRLGLLGPAGQNQVSWGNWDSFINYTGMLMPYLNASLVNVMGLLATIAEVVFGILLIIGYQIRLSAIGAAALTFIFALSMAIFTGLKAPLNYSVFPVSAGCLLLSCLPDYAWSLDKLRK